MTYFFSTCECVGHFDMSDMPPAIEVYTETHISACPAQGAVFVVPLGHLPEAAIINISFGILSIGKGNQTSPLIDLGDDGLPNVRLAPESYPPRK